MSEKAKAKELAYRTWVECGQNFSETERRVKDAGLPVTRQTLMAWADRYDWKGRAARADAESRKREFAVSESGLLDALVKQKARYEKFFDTLQDGAIDNQACYAFCGLIKTMMALGAPAKLPPPSGAAKQAPGVRGDGEQGTSSRLEAAPTGSAEVASTPLRVIRGEDERIAAIEEMVDTLICRVLTDPGKVSPAAFKEIREALRVIDKLKSGGRRTEDGERQTEDGELDSRLLPAFAGMTGNDGTGGSDDVSGEDGRRMTNPPCPPLQKGGKTGDDDMGAETEKQQIIITGPEEAKEALWQAFSRMLNEMLAHPEKIRVTEIERAQSYLAKMTEKQESREARERREEGQEQVSREDSKTRNKEEQQEAKTKGIEAQPLEQVEDAEALIDIGVWDEMQAIEALQDFVKRQLTAMRSQAGAAGSSQVKAVRDAMELIEELNKKQASASSVKDRRREKKGLSKETAEDLRRKLLMGEDA